MARFTCCCKLLTCYCNLQSHEKESQTKESLATLRREIDGLRTAVESGAGSSVAQVINENDNNDDNNEIDGLRTAVARWLRSSISLTWPNLRKRKQ